MTTLILQPDATAGIDTLIESSSNNNYGIFTTLYSGRSSAGPTTYRGLLKFDLSSIPPGAVVSSATVTLRLSLTSGAAQNVNFHRSLVTWFEGSQNAAVPSGGQDGSVWGFRNYNGSVTWTGGAGGASGTEWAASATATTNISTTTGVFYDFDVTSDVQGYVSATFSNLGWWLIGDEAANNLKGFSPSDSATPGNRPKITIVYDEGLISGAFAGTSSFTGAMPTQQMSGTFAGVASLSGVLAAYKMMSGTFAGAAAWTGAMPLQQMSGSFAGAAAWTGAMATQEMAGSFAGAATFTGGGRAVLLPRVPVWTAIVAGIEYAISGGEPFYRLQTTGLGISNIRNIKQRGPFQDGSTRRDFRLDERFINLVFLLQGATRAQADTYRDTLIEIFKPLTSTPCKIRVTRDDGVIKQIDTYAVGVLDLPETNEERFAATQRVAVQLEAPNPIWYGPTLQNIGFTSILGGGQGFAIPMMIPWAQQPGEYINVIESFYYEGNWKEYPVIVITGPAIDAKITNLTTNEKIDFTGYSIGAGDIRTIDLRFGTKTVKDAAGVLKNSELTTDSNLGTFHLEPSPGATGGINDIKVEIPSGGTMETRVSMMFYNRYIHL